MTLSQIEEPETTAGHDIYSCRTEPDSPGLVPAIHVLKRLKCANKGIGGRDKPGQRNYPGGPWRITFDFRAGCAWNLGTVDYH